MNSLFIIAAFLVSLWGADIAKRDIDVPDGSAIKTRVAGFAEELATTKMCFVAGTLVLVQVNGVEALLPIETLEPLARNGAKINAWAKCEHTGVEDWRAIVAFFTTHPEELFDLTIDTSGDGQADETLTGTGEHPFWVEAFAAFMPMRELAPGMRLTTARSTGLATIVGNTSKRGPTGERFTTYNFEVAGFHTYFVGQAKVWVHNVGRGPCETIFSIYENFRRRAGGNETQWDTLINARNAMRQDGFDFIPGAGPLQGTKVPGVYWRRTVKEVNDDMFKDVANGGMSLQKLPSHKQIKDEFRGSGIGSTAPKRLNDPDALESHHIIETWIQNRLMLSGSKTGDDIPGFITTFTQHRAGATTPPSIATQLQQRIGASTDELTISTALRDTYLDHGLEDVWQVTRKYLEWKGVAVP